MAEIQIPSADGQSFMAYVATPKTTPAPGIVVIQEIFGVNEGMRQKCDWLAREGFLAVCPDLFWRLEPGVRLTDKTQKEWDKALDLMNRFDIGKGIEDLRAATHTLRGHAHSTGTVGCMGYCLGGKLAYLMAARTKIDASVGYYGVGLEALVNEAINIKKPLLLHIAEEDGFVPKNAQKIIRTELHSNPNITIHSYPGVDHAFTRTGGQHYDEHAAKIADKRTVDFFRQNLVLSKAA